MGHVEQDPQNANRWVAKETLDDNTCQPCRDNNGRLYKNRADAYADYPGGSGYINCIGAQHGNECRGTVVKRRGGKAVTPELMGLVNRARAHEKKVCSARELTAAEGPAQGFRAAAGAPTAAAATGALQLYVYDYIGGYDGIDAMDVVEALVGAGDVDVHINSGGGSIFEGTAIYHALKNHAGTVRCYVDGVAASAASLIAMAGEEIIIEPASTMMVHSGSGGCWGTAKDMRQLAEVLDLLTMSIAGVYAARAGGEAQAWFELMESGDTWYNATQALDAGLATAVGASPGPPSPDGPPPTPGTEQDPDGALFDLIVATTRSPRPPAVTPAPIDVVGIRNALKGMLA